MAKKLVVCLDGTANQVGAHGNTNVVRLFRMLDLSDPSRQIAYYDPGVGTFSSGAAWTPVARWMSRTAGLAFGTGLRSNLGEAYTWLMRNWSPGDEVYVFGFSRGAYSARSVVGMLRSIGLMRPGSENLVPYAVSNYAAKNREWSDDDWAQLHTFSAAFAQHVDGRSSTPVAFLGLWDTVKAAGILRWDIKWPWSRTIPLNVARVRHAVAIDEKRKPYREYLLALEKPERTEASEVWFAGVHSDVGGTFDDDPRLSTIALRWMAEGARDAGILFDADLFAKECAVTADFATGTVHSMDRIWALVGTRRRPIPAGAHVHSSVRARMAADPAYRPGLPSDVSWADPGWPA
jgi:uncharacterized protein (DUF2235 family)